MCLRKKNTCSINDDGSENSFQLWRSHLQSFVYRCVIFSAKRSYTSAYFAWSTLCILKCHTCCKITWEISRQLVKDCICKAEITFVAWKLWSDLASEWGRNSSETSVIFTTSTWWYTQKTVHWMWKPELSRNYIRAYLCIWNYSGLNKIEGGKYSRRVTWVLLRSFISYWSSIIEVVS